ncbi:capsid cement protein [Actinoplanes sp. NBRC 101535]|uniref:capsid cement protein n=1 Tax=Actinoplanes sp. NBRC 101535 TaxID=3032196 RepID=UPI0024A1DF26|nr:capsid cement protein [Actinoplanes sp. NBRC 101535]GLY08258.1 hypothetical protein Acsp01_86370 [Actinoplanes sp. NBRC 101535]
MAQRDFIVHEHGEQLDRKLTFPASGGKVGDPCMVGRRPGYLLTDQDATTGRGTVKFVGSVRVNAHGYDASANNAIAAGDDLYYDNSPGASNPNINKDATNGKFFGVAAEALASGAKGAIIVDFV